MPSPVEKENPVIHSRHTTLHTREHTQSMASSRNLTVRLHTLGNEPARTRPARETLQTLGPFLTWTLGQEWWKLLVMKIGKQIWLDYRKWPCNPLSTGTATKFMASLFFFERKCSGFEMYFCFNCVFAWFRCHLACKKKKLLETVRITCAFGENWPNN